jgi:hypothetical protein
MLPTFFFPLAIVTFFGISCLAFNDDTRSEIYFNRLSIVVTIFLALVGFQQYLQQKVPVSFTSTFADRFLICADFFVLVLAIYNHANMYFADHELWQLFFRNAGPFVFVLAWIMMQVVLFAKILQSKSNGNICSLCNGSSESRNIPYSIPCDIAQQVKKMEVEKHQSLNQKDMTSS